MDELLTCCCYCSQVKLPTSSRWCVRFLNSSQSEGDKLTSRPAGRLQAALRPVHRGGQPRLVRVQHRSLGLDRRHALHRHALRLAHRRNVRRPFPSSSSTFSTRVLIPAHALQTRRPARAQEGDRRRQHGPLRRHRHPVRVLHGLGPSSSSSHSSPLGQDRAAPS